MITSYFKKSILFLSEYLSGYIIFIYDPLLCLTLYKLLLDAINLTSNPKNSNKANIVCYGWFIAPLKIIDKLLMITNKNWK